MCYFLTIAIPKLGDLASDPKMPRGLALLPYENSSIKKHLDPGMRMYALVSGGCSCDLYSDPAKKCPDIDPNYQKRIAAYKKKGWSKSKIERAISSSRIASSHNSSGSSVAGGLRSDIPAILSSLAKTYGNLMFLVHWYNGAVDTAKITVGAKHHICNISELDILAPDNLISLSLA